MIRLTFDRDGTVYAIVDSQAVSRFIKRTFPDGTVREIPIDYHVASLRKATSEEVSEWRSQPCPS